MTNNPALIECDSGKSKSVELICRVSRKMQEDGNAVSFSEMEDAIVNIHSIGTTNKIVDLADLKDIIRPALAKNDKSAKSFTQAFPIALSDTFHKKITTESADDLQSEVQK